VGESEDVVDLRGMKMQRVGGSVRTRGFRGDGAWGGEGRLAIDGTSECTETGRLSPPRQPRKCL
jgi:hypothetical protein